MTRAQLEHIVRAAGAITDESVILVLGSQSILGAFPAVPGDDDDYHDTYENCGWCDFDRICSRRRDGEFDAKSGDAGMAAWHGVRVTASPKAAL